jgi:hypothetical protein
MSLGCEQRDSRIVEGTNQEQIAKWTEDYGEDSVCGGCGGCGGCFIANARRCIHAYPVNADTHYL